MSGKLIDITQPLSPEIAIWPGDTKFSNQWVMQIVNGNSVNVGSVTMSLHTGTHADAPLHVADATTSIDECELDSYIGKALVIDASDSEVIEQCHVPKSLESGVERLLFKTMTASCERFVEIFSHFSPEAANALVALNIKLVGIDTPSVDPCNSKTLDAHHVFRTGNVLILENLFLDNVQVGIYELIAAPLKIVGMDASPVRALLREL